MGTVDTEQGLRRSTKGGCSTGISMMWPVPDNLHRHAKQALLIKP
ncbi:hypothetical protein [Nocardiopsis rhodophaea]